VRVIVWNSTTRELPRDEEGLRTSAVPRLSNRRDPSTTANRHSSVPVVIVRMALHATCPVSTEGWNATATHRVRIEDPRERRTRTLAPDSLSKCGSPHSLRFGCPCPEVISSWRLPSM
jgi:hypothetical protein